jgi:hypothetical protein
VRKFLKGIQRVLSYESRDGRAAEIAGWSNALAALGAGGGAWYGTGSWIAALAVSVVLFSCLRIALAHRVTVWIACAVGTIVVGATAGALAWTFGHIAEHPLAPALAAMIVGLCSTIAPAWAYTHIARQRANDVPDSLVDPGPVRSSRPSMP